MLAEEPFKVMPPGKSDPFRRGGMDIFWNHTIQQVGGESYCNLFVAMDNLQSSWGKSPSSDKSTY